MGNFTYAWDFLIKSPTGFLLARNFTRKQKSLFTLNSFYVIFF